MPSNESILIDDIQVEITRKRVKNINLVIKSPNGEVHVSAPRHVDTQAIGKFVASKLLWIKKHREKIRSKPVPVTLLYETGDKVPFQGRALELELIPHSGRARVVATEDAIKMYLPSGSDLNYRSALMKAWYRNELKRRLPALIARWEAVVGVKTNEWGVKQMKTRWGTCNIQAKRIWLNLELIKKPPTCLDMIIVHELVHLHERLHNRRFYALMDHFMPDWRRAETLLQSPFGVD